MEQEQPLASENFRCGMVSIVGRPNVGKSTLLNTILNEKVTIVSKVPQTTRRQMRGIYNDERGQIIFIDTPGLYLGKDKLDQLLLKTAFSTTQEVDCVIHLVDTSEPIGREEQAVIQRLSSVSAPIILGLNKIDLKGKFLPEYISLWETLKGKSVRDMERFVLLPLSGKDHTNIDRLLDVLFDLLPKGLALYPPDVICDIPRKIAIGDIIREKFLNVMREEIPHSLAVVVETIQLKRNKVVYISALIYVERESQKEIVIGKNGDVLKRVGTLARQELEELLEGKVFLDLHVKLQKKWRDDVSFLQEMGLETDGL